MILTRGKANGPLLLIECSLAQGFTVVDNVNLHRTELSATRKMKGGDELLLVCRGLRWVQVSFSKNS